jgi:hypothetical protein
MFQQCGQADFRLIDTACCPPIIACFILLHATFDLKDDRCARVHDAFHPTVRVSLSAWLP